MANRQKFDVGVIGGGVAVELAEDALRRLGNVAITHLQDTSKKFPGFHFVNSPDSIFDKDKVKSIYIATPVHTHAEFIGRAVDAGIPVLVEKPVTLRVRMH